MRVRLVSGKEVEIADTELGRGGMGAVYPTLDGTAVVKLFHKGTPELRTAMELVLGKYNCSRDARDASRAAWWSSLYVWPSDLVVEPGLGLLLPRFAPEMTNLICLFGPRNYARLPVEAKRWNRRVFLGWKLAQAVERMHQTGLAHSDLSHNNVLADPMGGQLRIIDMDGLVVPDFVPPQVLGTPGYIAPEVLARRAAPGIATDKHALAVLLYRLLLFRHPLEGPFDHGMDPLDADAIAERQLGEDGIYIDHPTDSRNRPARGLFPAAMLGATLQRFFERAFIEGLRAPDVRPQAGEWKIALGRLLDRLVTCTNPACDERYYPVWEGQTLACPWCKTALAISGGLPVLRLYEPGPRGPTPVSDCWIVGYPGKTLHQWHRLGGEPSPFAEQAPFARVEQNGGLWALTNLTSEGMATMNRTGTVEADLPVGRSVTLRDGMVVRLGAPPEGRFILVQWIRG